MGRIPAAAMFILDNIRRIETGHTDARAYNTIFGHNQDKLPKPLTKMTLREVILAGPTWTKRFKSSAAGGYQFMNATLKGLAVEHDLKGEQIFDADFQDWLGYQLLVRRGYLRYVNGSLNRTGFGKALAQEWASWPVLAATKGAHRDVKRGQTYYAGDALNKALVKPEEVERILDTALSLSRQVPTRPEPEVRVSGGFWNWIRSWFS